MEESRQIILQRISTLVPLHEHSLGKGDTEYHLHHLEGWKAYDSDILDADHFSRPICYKPQPKKIIQGLHPEAQFPSYTRRVLDRALGELVSNTAERSLFP